jgi:hypothetical protein
MTEPQKRITHHAEWRLPEEHPLGVVWSLPVLGLIERRNSYASETLTSTFFEIVRFDAIGGWDFDHGRPEEGDSRKLVAWRLLPPPPPAAFLRRGVSGGG